MFVYKVAPPTAAGTVFYSILRIICLFYFKYGRINFLKQWK